MEVSFRSMRIVNRLFHRPLRSIFRCVSNAAVKEEVNTELLNTFNQDIKDGGVVPVFRRALLFPSRIALQDDFGTYTYAGLYHAATALSKNIAAQLLGDTERTIAYMCGNDASHVVVQWAIWITGNIAVPLTPIHPAEMLKYFITDCGASLTICTQKYEQILRPISQELDKPLIVATIDKGNEDDQAKPVWTGSDKDGLNEVGRSNMWYGSAEAMLIYTSGTTSKPKGVVWSHSMLSTQISALHTAWQYSANDVVLHTLPLHHIHGQLNSLNASLAAGSRVRMLPTFTPHGVWSRLLGTQTSNPEGRVSVYHGVPAMYARLANEHSKLFPDAKTSAYVRDTLSGMRLMCAGSAPLPETLFNKWEEISGHRLLERYGMSEVGMALSNPYQPVAERTLSCVGTPLPGIRARIAAVSDSGQLEPLVTVECPDPDMQIYLDRLGITAKDAESANDWQPPTVTVHKEGKDDAYQGELLLTGPAVFRRYWNRAPKLDASEFTEDGWFRTGDTAAYSDGRFRILGRTSVDIIKTGGYKVSALQVESAILEHPSVSDAAVLGIEDENFGEIVSTVVVLKDKCSLTLKELKDMTGKKLAPYQLPKTMLIVNEMPRNVMGKLDKKEIRRLFAKDLVLKKS